MCSQLREGYYVNDKNFLREQDEETSESSEETSESSKNQEIKTFDNKSEQAKNFINNIKNYLNNGAVLFDSIVFDPKDNRFTWEGTIAGQVKWEFVFEDGTNPQVFFKIEEPQDLELKTTLAMHKLNTYFREKISAEISTAIQNKQFENIAQNNAV
jgi:hypothetical protein